MRYWILDNDETPQRFPLQRLIRRVREVVGSGLGSFELTKVRGYGLQVNEWDEALDGADRIVVPFELLDRLTAALTTVDPRRRGSAETNFECQPG